MSARQGRDEVYRVTRQHDGHFVACTNDGAAVGDNAALVQHVEGGSFVDAIHRLIGPTAPKPMPRATPEPVRTPPKVPPQTAQAREAGRRYLQTTRRIALQTVYDAENAGFLRYVDGGVIFVGHGPHGPENAIKRATDPADQVQKRDFKGSDKRFPPILPGNPATVWIVEGGVDALALHDLARRAGREPPTVIVSGGSRVRAFLENESVRAILAGADRVVVALENEANPDIQAKTDAEHRQQAGAVREITGREAELWRPQGAKDVAELNEKAAEIAETAQEDDHDEGPGMR